ncbi:MAG: non-homologous end-joining DNA ligase [Acidimicrobiia bacterium]|nr:non-homologous end-joining DNA ligase [Acidimicrobiia bacterium]
MLRYGISTLPPEGVPDADFLHGLVDRGLTALELPFVQGFPWKERRCAEFGEAAAEAGVALSVHAPYFAILTSDPDEDAEGAARTLSALEHTMKLGRALRARVIVAHTGYTKGRPAEALHDLTHRNLVRLEPKVRHLGVGLGLETSGSERAFGTLGDIAIVAADFSFVRPVIDWAHVHAMSRGGLTTPGAFAAVIEFLRAEFPGWAIDPLHCQFTDNRFGPKGEIMHVPYGEGTLRIGPLVEAALDAGLRMTVISEARDADSHERIFAEAREAEALAREPAAADDAARALGSGAVRFPDELVVRPDGDRWLPVGVTPPVSLSNLDKPFFSGGETKGDLLQYYASISSLLLPHLADRPIVRSRYPDGADGPSFYEKQAPGHTPGWVPLAPMHSDHRDGSIDYVTAPDLASLLWIVNMGAIEMHPWLSRVGSPEHPDVAVFDLDPAEGASWEQVVTTAGLVRVALGRLGLTGYAKTSGATGIHVYVPLEAEYPYARVRRFVETVGRVIVGADPALATMEWDIPKRRGRVFIDHNQNVGGKTIASVYSVRPRAGAPVSTPLLWEELEDVRPGDFTIATIWERVARYGDLFAPVLRGGQRLEPAERALEL